MGEWSSNILAHGTRWRTVVSFTSWPLYSLGKRNVYPLDMGLDGPQSKSESCGRDNNLPPREIESRRSSRSPYRLNYPGFQPAAGQNTKICAYKSPTGLWICAHFYFLRMISRRFQNGDLQGLDKLVKQCRYCTHVFINIVLDRILSSIRQPFLELTRASF
jgi:hypothetical protein